MMEQEKTSDNSESLSENLSTVNLNQTENEKERSKADTCEPVDNKHRRKLDKMIDSLLKKTNPNLNTIEDKYYTLVQKFIDLQEQNKKGQLSNKEFERTIISLTKQRDAALSDYNKMLLGKDKLENLCRELQKHNKLIKDENLLRIKEEEDKRKEISAKFQIAIDDINKQVSSNAEKNNSIMHENAQLTTKMKTLLEQYEIREQHIEKVLKHKDLEIELANAKFQQSELKFTELEERNKSEKKIFEAHCNELIKKCEFHQESEKQLRAQLSVYTDKYEEFQNTLKKSNSVFESFKSEMEKMTKKMHKLEQETHTWRTKWENSEKLLQNYIKLKEELEDKCKKMQAKAEAMEKLSRSLQAERNALKEEMKKYEEKVEKEIVDVSSTVAPVAEDISRDDESSTSTSQNTTQQVENKEAGEGEVKEVVAESATSQLETEKTNE